MGIDLTHKSPGDGADADEVQAKIDVAQERLTSLTQDYGGGLITRAEYLAARQGTEVLLREAQGRQTGSARRAVLDDLPSDADALNVAWETWALERRRAVLTAVIDRVVVAPAAYRGRPTFDPDRVSVTWRV